MIRNPYHPRKVIFWCIIPFLFLTLIPASSGTVSSIPPEDWVVSPGATLNYHFVVSENNSQGSLIDDLAQEYHYLGLDENLIGGPELEVNITEVNLLVDVSLVVSNILNFSSGQLVVSQKIENEWDLAPKNLIFPFVVPINQWEAMTAEFTAQLPGSANITFNSSWVGENSYLLSWAEDDPESEGSIRFDLNMVWEDEDGVLQWLDLDIEDASGNHDRMSLQLFSQNLNAPLAPADIILFVVLIIVFAVIMIGVVVVTKRYVEKDLDQHKNREALKPDLKKKLRLSKIGMTLGCGKKNSNYYLRTSPPIEEI